jgi:DNA-directed RNA polymerase subunit RPC12/RpoP
MIHLFKYKCLTCDLHFTLYSEHPERWASRLPFCPECGKDARFLIWRDTSEKFIFNFVPGETKSEELAETEFEVAAPLKRGHPKKQPA